MKINTRKMRTERKLLIEGLKQLKHIDDIYNFEPLDSTKTLMAEIEQVLRQPSVSNSSCGWVSVKDKLPEFGKSCLIYKNNKYPQIEIASLHKTSDKGGEFVIPFSGCKEIEFNDAITHWQYLPTPPSA